MGVLPRRPVNAEDGSPAPSAFRNPLGWCESECFLPADIQCRTTRIMGLLARPNAGRGSGDLATASVPSAASCLISAFPSRLLGINPNCVRSRRPWERDVAGAVNDRRRGLSPWLPSLPTSGACTPPTAPASGRVLPATRQCESACAQICVVVAASVACGRLLVARGGSRQGTMLRQWLDPGAESAGRRDALRRTLMGNSCVCEDRGPLAVQWHPT
jgi:hypothetical protein